MQENNSEVNDEDMISKNEEETQEAEDVKAENENIEETEDENQSQDETKTENEDELNMLRRNKDEIKKLNNEMDALKDRLLRITAEYENFRKRTAKEKEGIYTDACFDVLKEVLPVVDNVERAATSDGSIEDLKKGIEMTMKGLQGALEKLGVEEIDASSDFDPNLHQAVMHIEDESIEANQIVEVFIKGYKRGEKVIRHSVVKVAN